MEAHALQFYDFCELLILTPEFLKHSDNSPSVLIDLKVSLCIVFEKRIIVKYVANLPSFCKVGPII